MEHLFVPSVKLPLWSNLPDVTGMSGKAAQTEFICTYNTPYALMVGNDIRNRQHGNRCTNMGCRTWSR